MADVSGCRLQKCQLQLLFLGISQGKCSVKGCQGKGQNLLKVDFLGIYNAEGKAMWRHRTDKYLHRNHKEVISLNRAHRCALRW